MFLKRDFDVTVCIMPFLLWYNFLKGFLPDDNLMMVYHWLISLCVHYIVIVIWPLLYPNWINETFHHIILIVCLLLFDISCYLLSQTASTQKKVVETLVNHSLGPGKYAAQMYFHGYLKKILPVSEFHQKPELIERMKNYELKQRIKLPIKKLLILCPVSGVVEPVIGSHSHLIEKKHPLEPLELHRAGDKRLYINSVYGLVMNKKQMSCRHHVNVVAEYATPLPTIVSFFNELPKDFSVFKELVIHSFFTKLAEILKENRNCGKYCDLIIYDDSIEDGVTALRNRAKELLDEPKLDKGDCSPSLRESEFSLENDEPPS